MVEPLLLMPVFSILIVMKSLYFPAERIVSGELAVEAIFELFNHNDGAITMSGFSINQVTNFRRNVSSAMI